MALRKRRGKKDIPTIPVNSFADIAFLLIIFFIIATKLIQNTGVIADIPAGEKSESQADKTTTVQLHDNKITFNAEDIDIPALRQQLMKLDLHKKIGDNKVILLEATGEVNYQTYFDVMSTISAAGGVITIVREDEGK